jgi:hypothetical protein
MAKKCAVEPSLRLEKSGQSTQPIEIKRDKKKAKSLKKN